MQKCVQNKENKKKKGETIKSTFIKEKKKNAVHASIAIEILKS